MLRDQSISHISREDLARAERHFERKQQLRQQIRDEFLGLRPELPSSDPSKVQNVASAFVDQFVKGREFEVQIDGQVHIYEAGTRLTDAQGHPVELAGLVRQAAEKSFTLFAGPAPAGATVRKFRDEDDYVSQYDAAKTKEERSQIVAAWNKQNQ